MNPSIYTIHTTFNKPVEPPKDFSSIYKVGMIVSAVALVFASMALAGQFYSPLASFNSALSFMGTYGEIATIVVSAVIFVACTVGYLKAQKTKRLADKKANEALKNQISTLSQEIKNAQSKIRNLESDNSFLQTKILTLESIQKTDKVHIGHDLSSLDRRLNSHTENIILYKNLSTNLKVQVTTQKQQITSQAEKLSQLEQKQNEMMQLENTVHALRTELKFVKEKYNQLEATVKKLSTPQLPVENIQQLAFVEGPIQSLYRDILLMIFSSLPPAELNACSLVCKHWRALSADDTLWRQYTMRYISPDLVLKNNQTWKEAYIAKYANQELRQTLFEAYNRDIALGIRALPETCEDFQVYGNQIVTVSNKQFKIRNLQTLSTIDDEFSLFPELTLSRFYITNEGLCLIASTTGTIDLYDIHQKKYIGRIEETGFEVTALFAHRGKIMAAFYKEIEGQVIRNVVVWNLDTLEETHRFTHNYLNREPVSMIHAENNILAFGSEIVVQVWDLNKYEFYCEIVSITGLFDKREKKKIVLLSEELVDDENYCGYLPWKNINIRNKILYLTTTDQRLEWDLNTIKDLYYGRFIEMERKGQWDTLFYTYELTNHGNKALKTVQELSNGKVWNASTQKPEFKICGIGLPFENKKITHKNNGPILWNYKNNALGIADVREKIFEQNFSLGDINEDLPDDKKLDSIQKAQVSADAIICKGANGAVCVVNLL